jgi:hypothetical protein
VIDLHECYIDAGLHCSCDRPYPFNIVQRSPPRLFTVAACSGLKPAPDGRLRGAYPHLSCSAAPTLLWVPRGTLSSRCHTASARPRRRRMFAAIAGPNLLPSSGRSRRWYRSRVRPASLRHREGLSVSGGKGWRFKEMAIILVSPSGLVAVDRNELALDSAPWGISAANIGQSLFHQNPTVP